MAELRSKHTINNEVDRAVEDDKEPVVTFDVFVVKSFRFSKIVLPSDEVQNICDLCDVVIQSSLVTSLNCVKTGHLE